jgi:hypothetical protein
MKCLLQSIQIAVLCVIACMLLHVGIELRHTRATMDKVGQEVQGLKDSIEKLKTNVPFFGN